KIGPVVQDIRKKAKELAKVNTRIRLTTSLETAKKSPNLIMLGRQPNLSGLPTLSSSQIRTKPDSLTALVRALKTLRNPQTRSTALLKLDHPPRSRESTSPETPTWRTLGSREEVMSWLTTSRGSRTSKTELVVDIETHGDNDFLHP